MSIQNARTGNVRLEEAIDPRTRLAQEKFFTLRPKPLERWLWSHGVSAAAERVFWFHWSEGARNGNWCSQASLQYVAEHCVVDVSTVTRAYQALRKLHLVRRTDPGRDAANPFQQATAVTEVLLPRDLAAALNAFPNRPRPASVGPAAPIGAATPSSAEPRPRRPFAGLDLKQQRARIQALSASMSEAERQRWNRAICDTAVQMDFDPDTRVPVEIQAEISAYLASREPPKVAPSPTPQASSKPTPNRRLSVFEAARVRRGVQLAVGAAAAPEIWRQVLWAIEEGALKKFSIALAINIALKKLRLQEWSRPNRMPPNWMRATSELA